MDSLPHCVSQQSRADCGESERALMIGTIFSMSSPAFMLVNHDGQDFPEIYRQGSALLDVFCHYYLRRYFDTS